jgi:voltage-gated potassium channel
MPGDTAASARRRRVIREITKLILTVAALFALYFVAPLGLLTRVPIGLTLVAGLVLLGAASTWEVLAVTAADRPAVRALEALLRIIPLFLILFAAAYSVLEQGDPGSFTGPLTRSDALYFTVTVFSTVGFGDIAASTELSRDMVTFQMLLDLVILGLGLRVLTRAVQVGTDRKRPAGTPDSPDIGDQDGGG